MIFLKIIVDWMKLFKKYCVFLHLQSLIMNKREEQLNIIYLNFFMIFFSSSGTYITTT